MRVIVDGASLNVWGKTALVISLPLLLSAGTFHALGARGVGDGAADCAGVFDGAATAAFDCAGVFDGAATAAFDCAGVAADEETAGAGRETAGAGAAIAGAGTFVSLSPLALYKLYCSSASRPPTYNNIYTPHNINRLPNVHTTLRRRDAGRAAARSTGSPGKRTVASSRKGTVASSPKRIVARSCSITIRVRS